MPNLNELRRQFAQLKNENLNLDMTRGKPSEAQLDLSKPLLSILKEDDYLSPSGVDCRNYSSPDLLTGLPELKQLFADVFELDKDQIIIGGNASLNLMSDIIHYAFQKALPGAKKPWNKNEKIKFICPSPGYDRHFGICEALGIEMLSVPLTGFGPDMDLVEKLVNEDETIKGIWCVPKYSNPTGETYSKDTVKRLVSMKPKADDFRIFWDNAYALHHLSDHQDSLVNILKLATEMNNPNCVFMFASTSKITFAGSGIAFVASNKENVNWIVENLKYQTIGFDKLNQLRHLIFFKTKENVIKHMQHHARILKPKFDAVLKILEKELGTDGQFATWTYPKGGYFISLNTKANLAKKVVSMAETLGVKLTKAGATFPYAKDPLDQNIRIAPSMPTVSDIMKASEALALCIQIATIEANESVMN